MKIKDRINKFLQKVNKITDKMTDSLTDSSVLFIKTTGKTVGYTNRAAIGAKDVLQRADEKTALLTGGFKVSKKQEVEQWEVEIKLLEEHRQEIFAEIGLKRQKFSSDEEALKDDQIISMVNQVRQLKSKITKIKTSRQRGKKKDPADCVNGSESLKKFIQKTVRKEKFLNKADKELFSKATFDIIDRDEKICCQAIAELGRIGGNRAIPILQESLKFYHSKPLVADILNALILLDEVGSDDIFRNYINDSSSRVRIAALKGLYKFGSANCDDEMISRLKDPSRDVRKTAITLLGWKRVKKATSAILQVTQKDVDPQIRSQAVTALASICDPSTVFPLIRELPTANPELMLSIFQAVKCITGKTIDFDTGLEPGETAKKVEELKKWWLYRKDDDLE